MVLTLPDGISFKGNCMGRPGIGNLGGSVLRYLGAEISRAILQEYWELVTRGGVVLTVSEEEMSRKLYRNTGNW